jgi:hypothetical protein
MIPFLFVYFSYFVQTLIQSHDIIRRRSLRIAQWEKPPWGAEPRLELGPALQQADALALPTELRRTLASYAALY